MRKRESSTQSSYLIIPWKFWLYRSIIILRHFDSDRFLDRGQSKVSFWKKLVDTGALDKDTPSPLQEAQVIAPTQNIQHPHTPEDAINQRFGKIRSALGPGTIIQGKLSFDTAVRIDGKLSGEIFSSKTLILGPTAQVSADIEAAVLVVMGKYEGSVKAAERVELWSGADFSGNVRCPVLAVQEGARFNAACAMLSSAREVSMESQSSKVISQGSSSKSSRAVTKSNVRNEMTDITCR
ncbi:MAG: hypothetical protein DCC75_04380 [Proteobacteria bacterium]|nr:MAG: hypothetical protein DCC75_04380 [Pseudomonadota bacterium]